MKQGLIFLFALVLTSCEKKPVSKIDNQWFDLPAFVSSLTLDMSQRGPLVSKTFELNNEIETKEFNNTDSAFWAKQLTVLREIDLNSPQLRGSIKGTEGLQDEQSYLLIDSYILESSIDVPLKKLSIYYLDEPSDIRKITAELDSDNFIAHSETKVDLWLNRYGEQLLIDSLIIIGEDITLMQATRCYQITSKTLW